MIKLDYDKKILEAILAKFNCRFRSENLLFQPATTFVWHDRKSTRNRQLNLAQSLAHIQRTTPLQQKIR
jgi:hypothetical protein